MENSDLNKVRYLMLCSLYKCLTILITFKAHYYARRAESYLKSNENREESISFLNQVGLWQIFYVFIFYFLPTIKCIDSLDKSLSTTTSMKAAESIKLQRNHHAKMRDLIMHNNSSNYYNHNQQHSYVNSLIFKH